MHYNLFFNYKWKLHKKRHDKVIILSLKMIIPSFEGQNAELTGVAPDENDLAFSFPLPNCILS